MKSSFLWMVIVTVCLMHRVVEAQFIDWWNQGQGKDIGSWSR